MKHAIKRTVLGALTASLTAMAATGLVTISASDAKADYPERPVRMIVPFGPGGTTDLVARVLAAKFSEELGQTIVIENKGGAGGNIGVAAASTADPDGYTIVMGTTSNMAINATLYKALPYDPTKSFVPIGNAASAPQVLVVNNTLPVSSVSELIAYAKKDGVNPTFGSGGVGTPVHLAGEIFKKQAGLTNMVHVPYRGSAKAVADLIAGNITMIVESLPSALKYINGGQLKALAHTGSGSIDVLPGIPPMKEAGVDLEVSGWFGLFAPAGVPAQVTDKLVAALKATLKSSDVRKGMATNGALPGDIFGADFGKFVASEGQRWGEVVNAANIEKR